MAHATTSQSRSSDLEQQRPFRSDRARKGRRPRFRPDVEVIERRVVLSGQPLIIASLGDSLTDEYQFYGAATPTPPSFPALLSGEADTLPPEIYLTGRDAARNWVMEVGATLSSQLSFGNFTTSSRGMTRNQGYQENWAENGTTASGPDVSGTGTTFVEEYNGIPSEFSLGEDPMPGLVTQTSPGDIPIGSINVVTILIGANDYNAALSAYTEQSDKLDTTVFDMANTNIENGISTAISTIQAAAVAQGNTNLKFVLITTPDITLAPLIQDEAGGALPALKVIIGKKIDALDLNLATTYHDNSSVALVNSTAIVNNFIQDPVIDGVTVNMEGAGQDYTDGFTGDGFHPGTIVQGLVAQAIVAAVNTLEGSQVVTPISDADIVNYARNSQSSIALTSSESQTTVGQAITFEATVTPALLGAPPATGTVTFEEIIPATGSDPARPGIILGTVPLGLNGTATLTVKNLVPGTHPIAAIYNGDHTNTARLSSTLDQVVSLAPAATSTTLFASPNPSQTGKVVALTAIVNAQESGLPTPSGSVTFRDETTGQVLGTVPLSSQGVATLGATGLTIGTHRLVAAYGGTDMLTASASLPLVEVVNPPPPPPNRSTTTEVLPTRFVRNGRVWVNLQIVVHAVDPMAPLPSGSVDLSISSYRVLTLGLIQGVAQKSVPLGTIARRYVSSYYLGDPILNGSGSPFVYINPRTLPRDTVPSAANARSAGRATRAARHH